MFVRQACNTLRMGLLRRSMATTGRRPETPNKMTPLHQIGAFTAICCGILGPSILLMLTRERPISEH